MTESTPLRPEELFHTGIVVDDLDVAKADLGERLGLTWHEGGADVAVLTDAGVSTVPSAYALSKEGPHHIELCQAVEGTVWAAPTPAGGAHHLGYWVDDVDEASAALDRTGAPRVAAIAVTDDAPPMCAYHRTGSGLLVEVVSRGMRRFLLPEDR